MLFKPRAPLIPSLERVKKVSPIEGQMIVNLSTSLTLSLAQTSLLNRGLSFIPTSLLGVDTKKKFKIDVQNYHRKLKLIAFFEGKESEHLPFIGPSTWTPSDESIPDYIHDLITLDRKTIKKHYKAHPEPNNISALETRALTELQKNKNIVIKPADKGSSIVIMDRDQYVFEVERQLNDQIYYKKLSKPIYLDTIKPVLRILNSLKNSKYINEKQRLYLIGEQEPQPRRFYILPKIHKDSSSWTVPGRVPAGRPIVSDCGSETYRTAEYLDHFLNPLSTLHPSYLKDTYHFVNIIKNLIVPPNSFLFTMDVKSLYTNIPIEAGIKCVKDLFDKIPNIKRPDKQLLELLDINLTRNDFMFDGKFYLQVKGTAMGKIFAPSYANIFMANWEERALSKCPLRPSHIFRYLDDIWGVWPGSETEFKQFVTLLNSCDPSIQLTYELNDSSIDFLDTTIFKGPDFLTTCTFDIKVFFKKTDTHALLHKNSFHPKHTYKGLIKSQLLRFNRICSRPQYFEFAFKTLFRALKYRGYSRSFLRECLRTFLIPKIIIQKDPIPLIVTYSSAVTLLGSKLKTNFKALLNNHTPFTNSRVISSFRRNQNLGDILVHAKIPPLKHGVTPREDENDTQLTQTRFVQNHKDNTWYRIIQLFSLESHNCIYLVTCSRCPIQLVGETGMSLATRCKQHNTDINNNQDLDSPLVRHFLHHDRSSMRICGLERNTLWTLEQRRKKERFWLQRLGATPIRLI